MATMVGHHDRRGEVTTGSRKSHGMTRSVRHKAHDRRRFLAALGGCGALLLSGASGVAAAAPPRRRLSFHNLHTRESLELVYWEAGRYLPHALSSIDDHLRDFRTGDVYPIETGLLDLLHALNGLLRNSAPLHVISGYRSPATNAMLAARSSGVARRSYHMYGMAIDIRAPGVPLEHLREAGLALRRGGVGYYPADSFVHLDVGPVRAW